jgi:hypothetical protein
MLSEEVLLMLCLLLTSLLLFLSVYFMITLSDLESDYINSLDCSARLNVWTMPRLVLMVVHSLLLLVNQSWLVFLLSLPFTLWLVYSKVKVKQGDSGLYDPTVIHIRENLRGGIKQSLAYMGYHMASFFIYMWMLVSLMTVDGGVSREVPW